MESLIGLERIKDWIIENFVNKMIRVMNICGTFGEKFFFDLRNFDNETNARILFFFFLLKFLWKNFVVVLLGGGNIGGRRKLDFCLALLN